MTRSEHQFQVVSKKTHNTTYSRCSALEVMIFPSKMQHFVVKLHLSGDDIDEYKIEGKFAAVNIFFEELRQCKMNLDAASINILSVGWML